MLPIEYSRLIFEIIFGINHLNLNYLYSDNKQYMSEKWIVSEYSCHGTWIENDTAYLVASTEKGRYCLVYSASAAATGSRELSVTGHLASCPRASHRHVVSWQVNLTSYGKHYHPCSLLSRRKFPLGHQVHGSFKEISKAGTCEIRKFNT